MDRRARISGIAAETSQVASKIDRLAMDDRACIWNENIKFAAASSPRIFDELVIHARLDSHEPRVAFR